MQLSAAIDSVGVGWKDQSEAERKIAERHDWNTATPDFEIPYSWSWSNPAVICCPLMCMVTGCCLSTSANIRAKSSSVRRSPLIPRVQCLSVSL